MIKGKSNRYLYIRQDKKLNQYFYKRGYYHVVPTKKFLIKCKNKKGHFTKEKLKKFYVKNVLMDNIYDTNILVLFFKYRNKKLSLSFESYDGIYRFINKIYF